MIEALQSQWLTQQVPDMAPAVAGSAPALVVDDRTKARAEDVVARAMGRR